MADRPKHVLSVSYDVAQRTTRRLPLERAGYSVTSADSFQEASARCWQDGYDLFILGHSIPPGDKKDLTTIFRANCRVPVLSLQRRGEDNFPSADYHALVEAPQEFMQLVAKILTGKAVPPGAKAASDSTSHLHETRSLKTTGE